MVPRVFMLTLTVIISLMALSLLLIYLLSERRLNQVPEVAAFTHTVKVTPEILSRGHHITRTRGCFGCHGQQLEGRVHDQWPWVKRAIAPNLARLAKQHDAATLERAIRHGIDHTGQSMWSMPSYNYVNLSDDDTAALIAYLKSAPVVDHELSQTPSLGLQARLALISGNETTMAEWVLTVPPFDNNAPRQTPFERGEYTAFTTCNECHGLDLKGDPDSISHTPDLAIVGAYSLENFRTLMKTGTGLGGRTDLGLMTVVAKDRFSAFTDQEISDLHTFLTTRVDTESEPL